MQLPITVFYAGVLVAGCGGTFITLRDERFEGEDPGVRRELRRLADHSQLVRRFQDTTLKTIKLSPRPPPPPAPAPPAPVNVSNQINAPNYRRARVTIDWYYPSYAYYKGTTTDWKFPNEPADRVLSHNILDLVEQAVYAAQYRIKDLEPIVKKYLDLLEFRISFIFKRLEVLEREMEMIYATLIKGLDARWKTSVRRTYEFIYYYEIVLSKHVDVTYMCERVAWLHENDKERRVAEMNEKQREMKKNREKPTGSYGPDDYKLYKEMADANQAAIEKKLPPLVPFTKDVDTD